MSFIVINVKTGEVVQKAASRNKLSKRGVIVDTAEGPVAVCRKVVGKLKAQHSRGEVVAACIAAGVHPATARTQYQRLYQQDLQ